MNSDSTTLAGALPSDAGATSSFFGDFNFMTLVYIILCLAVLYILIRVGFYIYRSIKRQGEINALKKDLMVRRVLSKLSKGGDESDKAKSELNLKLSVIDLQFKHGQALINKQSHLGKNKAWFIMLGEPDSGKTTLLNNADAGLVCSEQGTVSTASFGASPSSRGGLSGLSAGAQGVQCIQGDDAVGSGTGAAFMGSGTGAAGGVGASVGSGTSSASGMGSAAEQIMGQGTTALNSSTRTPPNLADENSPAVQFYVGHNQVILDVSGQVFFDHWADGSSAEYAHICKLINRKHRAEPLRGIILCIPADALLADDNKLTQKKAMLMLEELLRLTHTVKQHLPCYILITKLDVVLGFREFFESLNSEMKDQAFGLINPYGEQFDAQLIEKFFKLMTERLQEGSFALFESKEVFDLTYQGRSRLDKSAEIYLFAQNFANLQYNLMIYLKTLFGVQSNGTAFFRGLFFTSGQDNGYCLNFNFAKLANQSMDDALFIDDNFKSSRSYFIKGAVEGQIFADEPVNHFTAQAQLQRDLPRYATAAGCALFSIYLLYGVLFAAPHLQQVLSNEVIYYASLDKLFKEQAIRNSPMLGVSDTGSSYNMFEVPMAHDSTISRLSFFMENQSHMRHEFDLPVSLWPGALLSFNWFTDSDKPERSFIYNQVYNQMVYMPLVKGVEQTLMLDQRAFTSRTRNALFALMDFSLYRHATTSEQINEAYSPNPAHSMMTYLYPSLTNSMRNEILYFLPEYDWYSKSNNTSIILDEDYAKACIQGLANWEQHWQDLSNYPESKYQRLKRDINAANLLIEGYAQILTASETDISKLNNKELSQLNERYQEQIQVVLTNAAKLDELNKLLWLEFQQSQQNKASGASKYLSLFKSNEQVTEVAIQVPTEFQGGQASNYERIKVPVQSYSQYQNSVASTSNGGGDAQSSVVKHSPFLDEAYADYLSHIRYDFAFLKFFDETSRENTGNHSGLHFGKVEFEPLMNRQAYIEQDLAQDYFKLKDSYFDLKQSLLFSPNAVLDDQPAADQNQKKANTSGAAGVLSKVTGGNNSGKQDLESLARSASLQEIINNFKLNYSMLAQLLALCQLPEEMLTFNHKLEAADNLAQTFELFDSGYSYLQGQQQKLAKFLDEHPDNSFLKKLAPIGMRIINLNQQEFAIASYTKMLTFYPKAKSDTAIMGKLSKELAQHPFGFTQDQPLQTAEYEAILGTSLNLRAEYNPWPFIAYLKPLLYINNWMAQQAKAQNDNSGPLAAANPNQPNANEQISTDVSLIYSFLQKNPRLMSLHKVFNSYSYAMINYYAQMADHVQPQLLAYSDLHNLAQNSRAYEINDHLHSLYDMSYRVVQEIDDSLLDANTLKAKKQALDHLSNRLNDFSIKLNDDCATTLTAWSLLPEDALTASNLIESNPDLSRQLWTRTSGDLPWWKSFEESGRSLMQNEAVEQGTLTIDTLMERLNAFPAAKDGKPAQALEREELNSLYAAFKFLGLRPMENPLASLQGVAGRSSTGLDGLSGAAQQMPGMIKTPSIRQQIMKQSNLNAHFLENLDQVLDILCAKNQAEFELFVPNAAKQNQLYKNTRFNMPLATLTYRYISAAGASKLQEGAKISSAQRKNRKLFSGLVYDQVLTLKFYEFSNHTKPQAEFTLYKYPALQMYLNPSTIYDEKEKKAYVPLTITSDKGSFIYFIGLQFNQEFPTPENWPSGTDFKSIKESRSLRI